MKKSILIVVVVLIAIGAGIAYYMWNKPKRTAEDEKPFATVTAVDIYKEFAANQDATTAKYLNKIIQVSGKVESVDKDGKGAAVVNVATEDEMGGIMSATFAEGQTVALNAGDPIQLKGIVAGYVASDMLGGEVQLTRCALVH